MGIFLGLILGVALTFSYFKDTREVKYVVIDKSQVVSDERP
jgi:hypothetical protein